MIEGFGSAVPMLLLYVTLAGVTPSPAASTAQDEAAQQAFRAGVEAARQQRWVDARALFEKAYGLSPRPVVLINLAGAQVRTGRLTEAARNYHRILDDQPLQETASFRKAAAEVLPALEARIPRVRVRPTGLSSADVIRIDGDIVDAPALGNGHPLDPGEHTLVVQSAGVERARVLFTLAEREVRDIALPLPVVIPPPTLIAPAVGPTEPTESGPPHAASPPERSMWASPWTWIALGVAGASATAYLIYQNRDSDGFSGNIPPGRISVP